MVEYRQYPVTTGQAAAETWNIFESEQVQERLAMLIEDYLVNSTKSIADPHDTAEKPKISRVSKIPRYIRDLFSHYCWTQTTPRMVGIEEIYDQMLPELSIYFFEEMEDGDVYTMPEISEFKVSRLFPNADNIDVGTLSLLPPTTTTMTQHLSLLAIRTKFSSSLSIRSK